MITRHIQRLQIGSLINGLRDRAPTSIQRYVCTWGPTTPAAAVVASVSHLQHGIKARTWTPGRNTRSSLGPRSGQDHHTGKDLNACQVQVRRRLNHEFRGGWQEHVLPTPPPSPSSLITRILVHVPPIGKTDANWLVTADLLIGRILDLNDAAIIADPSSRMVLQIDINLSEVKVLIITPAVPYSSFPDASDSIVASRMPIEQASNVYLQATSTTPLILMP